MTDALIHLRVPAAIKSRWVRESRAAGMRLTDWIIQRVEAQPMDKITPISIGTTPTVQQAALQTQWPMT